jgi:phosphate:Na+ symporter
MILTIGTFIGGLGLFLLAVSMITDGLKLAAGDALREILANSTRTRIRGVVSGVLVTGIVQSSSAVTVATIGFVNAGLLTLPQSLGVIYGANIGTTMTGWIVAIVGFTFKVETFALPLIGLGMMAKMLRPDSRMASLGEALAGFGLFFIGVDLLRDAFAAFSGDIDVAGFAPHGGLGVMLYVALGFFMTLITQSSSAAIAITLTAATGGVLGINAAAAMVIGANVGTTSTAAFAVIGATANARRVAAAHVVFNLLTGGVALLLLPLLMWIVDATSSVLGLREIPAVSLALFHTIFNVLGLLIMWPLTTPLANYLSERFTTEWDRFARPRYLDRNVLATPVLAMEALNLELKRAAEHTREFVIGRMSAETAPDRAAVEQERSLRALIDAMENFITDLEMDRLPESQRGNLPNCLRTSGYLEEVVGLVIESAQHQADIEAISRPPVVQDIVEFQADIVEQIRRCDPGETGFAMGELEDGYERLRGAWHELKSRLLDAAAARHIPIGRLNSALEGLRGYLKIAEQMTKAAERLHLLGLSVTPEATDNPAADRHD